MYHMYVYIVGDILQHYSHVVNLLLCLSIPVCVGFCQREREEREKWGTLYSLNIHVYGRSDCLYVLCICSRSQAVDLHPVDLNGKADPYIIVRWGTKKEKNDKDNKQVNTLNPIFGKCVLVALYTSH